MELTKFTHACVRLDDRGRTLVIDPGIWAEPEAVDGAGGILLTHEHSDHVNATALAAALERDPDLALATTAAVLEAHPALAARATVVSPGDRVEVAGFDVRVVGGEHAETYDGLPGCSNVGFIVDDSVYHPGDALYVPQASDLPARHEQIAMLLLPISAPWLKLAEAIDFVRAVAPAAAIGIHDAPLSDIGRGLATRWLESQGNTAYSHLAAGSTTSV